jgi:hypothetical protein
METLNGALSKLPMTATILDKEKKQASGELSDEEFFSILMGSTTFAETMVFDPKTKTAKPTWTQGLQKTARMATWNPKSGLGNGLDQSLWDSEVGDIVLGGVFTRPCIYPAVINGEEMELTQLTLFVSLDTSLPTAAKQVDDYFTMEINRRIKRFEKQTGKTWERKFTKDAKEPVIAEKEGVDIGAGGQ